MIHTIKEIVKVESYKITLKFSTGEVLIVDLAEKIQEWGSSPNSKFGELKKHEVFSQVKLDREFGSLMWDNGIDLCPDVLYDLSGENKKQHVA
jgi:hypothetical protein